MITRSKASLSSESKKNTFRTRSKKKHTDGKQSFMGRFSMSGTGYTLKERVQTDPVMWDATAPNGQEVRLIKLRNSKQLKRITSISHPNLLPVVDVLSNETDPGHVVIVIAAEMVDMDLYNWLATDNGSEPGNIGDRLQILRDVYKALRYIHKHKLLHPKIDPHNVWIGDKLDAKFNLIDLSSTRPRLSLICSPPLSEEELKDCSPEKSTTPQKEVIEIPPPEVLKTGSKSCASKNEIAADIWAFGVLAFYTLFNHVPFSTRGLDEDNPNYPLCLYRRIRLALRSSSKPGFTKRLLSGAIHKYECGSGFDDKSWLEEILAAYDEDVFKSLDGFFAASLALNPKIRHLPFDSLIREILQHRSPMTKSKK